MDDLNITIEEYIRLEEEKARRHDRMFNWQTATFKKVKYYEDEYNCFIDFKTKFPAIVFHNTLTSDTALPCKPAVNGYTEDIMHDYEHRFETIWGKSVSRVHILDFKHLTPEIRHDLAMRLRMVYTGGDGHQV
nr:hypothetical protein [Tanacetum cinerariifolium]